MSELTPTQNEFLFYASEDGTISIQTLVADDTIWITQSAMEDVFGIHQSGVSRHLKNIFESGELDEHSNMQKMHIATSTKPVNFYNLNIIISVGYRANSYRATQFRIWATKILKEYLVKGFTLDDERLKQGKVLFDKDHFDELLERIREIRASEKRFYKKITELYKVCSYDYDENSREHKEILGKFYANMQNKLLFAVSRMTGAEIRKKRASYNLPHMGLTTWDNKKKSGKVTKKDVTIAKNYLLENEIDDLNRLDNMFLDYIENLAKKQKKMRMQDWSDKLSSFLEFNEYEVLQGYGKITKDAADKWSIKQYNEYKPIQSLEFKDNFDNVAQSIKATGKLPDEVKIINNKKEPDTKFNKSLKQAMDYNPKD
ncbi:Putative DNA-binding protein in cluster with Type I restriction-modification system [Bathymodiolus brooksi thiotrophic gill symbiont]|nr:Putative DNA-binding protein in cluster with Type I restriction-modification system [Bathymodiolus brooksi thiotrophic gill symbiont]